VAAGARMAVGYVAAVVEGGDPYVLTRHISRTLARLEVALERRGGGVARAARAMGRGVGERQDGLLGRTHTRRGPPESAV
jgi:hypothetical protein